MERPVLLAGLFLAPFEPGLAPLFVCLTSNESSYITGEVIGVTGGKPLA